VVLTQEEYTRLITHPQNPLLDRPISAQLPPGSTFKTIVAAAGLEFRGYYKKYKVFK
jgi:penicillin-binding protein 2